MASLFRRKPAEPAELEPAEPEDEGTVTTAARAKAPASGKAYTPSKKELGKITPKRKAGGRAVEPPPANRREALRRMRAKQREARAEARAGMLAGKEEYLLPRDKGPERALVRDVVDARRNLASYFLPGALIVIVGSSAAMPAQVRLATNAFWFALAIGVVIDSVLLSRRVRLVLLERFPRSDSSPRSHYWYAIMRSLSMRRMRMPAPRVKPGARV